MIRTTQEPQAPSLFNTALAFRPFFWLASVFAVISLGIWYAYYSQWVPLNPKGGMLWWHQHEMIFGFGAAVVVGFLLTAVQNWTGIPSLTGPRLWGLTLLWLMARMGLAFSNALPYPLLMALDLAFLPLVGIAMASYVIRAKRWRNLIFVPVLLLLTLANLGMHLGNLKGDYQTRINSAYMGV